MVTLTRTIENAEKIHVTGAKARESHYKVWFCFSLAEKVARVLLTNDKE